MQVGGKTPNSDPDQGAGRGCGKPRTTVEPVFWHARPEVLYQEMLASYNLCSIIDCQAADGGLATLAATERVPYIGFCLTESHLKAVQEVIIGRVLKEMARPNSKVYESKLTEILGSATSASPSSTAPRTGQAGQAGQGGQVQGGSSSTAQNVLQQFEAGSLE